ncbi:hypothetical protein JDV02_005367 [Purpureocillium takamizusanense]|uniref:Uncharacterized protein n=1 Tax=Purpureocillium takamizusanense TaxID=2060973 RepID=A0A9Q8VAY3_9HYPO|nr:uncharacterized protein JDV02_005367 [Purpureocillium takamizusanense]UNI19158.1 hypothetical protein JDV02_005367 [Purpureocillium takamizusanense]
MLASHRDQENLAHSQQIPTKQQPKTPGARYPKTPLAFRNDENLPTAFAGKSGLGGAGTRPGGMNKMTAKKGQQQSLVTPMEPRTRAPLGNKTTNAKAKAGRSGGVKERVNEIEKSQAKHTTVQKPKLQPVDVAPIKIKIQPDSQESHSDLEDEPEYAPPPVAPLPYESDILPKGGLTSKGLKGKESFFKGFYQHYSRPDGNGMSREEKKFNEEMEAILRRVEERSQRELDDLQWSAADIEESMTAIQRKSEESKSEGARLRTGSLRNPPTITSKRAASALAMSSGAQKPASEKATVTSKAPRRPLSALMSRSRPAKPVTTTTTSATGNIAAEAASRTTIGYNKGRTASSMLSRRAPSVAERHKLGTRAPTPCDAGSDLTITPARIRHPSSRSETPAERLQFLSIFDDVDDEDLPLMRGALLDSDDDEEFEMKLTI